MNEVWSDLRRAQCGFQKQEEGSVVDRPLHNHDISWISFSLSGTLH